MNEIVDALIVELHSRVVDLDLPVEHHGVERIRFCDREVATVDGKRSAIGDRTEEVYTPRIRIHRRRSGKVHATDHCVLNGFLDDSSG